MLREPCHLSDQELLLLADGEISRRRARKAGDHLTACWLCRSRLSELEGTIADFVSLHRRTLDPQLPAAMGSRALLRARLAAAEPATGSWQRLLPRLPLHRAAACVCLVAIIALLGGRLALRRSQSPLAGLPIPDRNLTPGATRPVSIGDICSMPHEEVVRAVSTGLRQEVFKEYGIKNPRPEDYEIDYLISPGLGGTEDIHNLWPEPYTTAAWNARVKDTLEERLHQLVCDGKMDLPTAQREIATDWISAYKKYLSPDQYPHSNPVRSRVTPLQKHPISAHPDRASV